MKVKWTEEDKAQIRRHRAEMEARDKRRAEVVARNGIDKMTDEELKANLVTCDYRGKEAKGIILEELLGRECGKAFEAGCARGNDS